MSINESETEMSKRKMYALTDDTVQRLKIYARTWGSVASHCASAELVPVDEGMTERTYTREDMARSWDEGHEDGAAWAHLNAVLDGGAPSIPNPYREQEEA